jgi:hypothetical protein
MGFPCWWFLSYEGAGIISNTKLNGFGFTALNIIAKGGFTMHLVSMVKRYKRKRLRTSQPKPTEPAEAPEMSRQVSVASVASMASLPELPKDRQVTLESVATLPELPQDRHQRTPEKKLTNQSLLWVIEGLREFDGQAPEEKVWALEGIVRSVEKVSSADQLTEKLSSADQLTNEEIMTELMRRLPANTSSGDNNGKLTYGTTTAASDISSDEDSSDKFDTDLCPAGARPCRIPDADIQNACTSFVRQGNDNSDKNDKDSCPAGARPCRISDADIQNACTSSVLQGDDNSDKNDKDSCPAGARPCRISDADIQNACTSFVLDGDGDSDKSDKDSCPAGARPCRTSDADIQNACTSFVLEQDIQGPGAIAVSGKLHRVFVVDDDFEFEEPATARYKR